MQLEQITRLREKHGQFDMCVFRTEGLFHHERGEMSFLLWDDKNNMCHALNTNPTAYLYPSEPIRIDSFDYEAITGIYSDMDKQGMKQFLGKLKNENVINEQVYNNILEVYKDLK